MKIIKTIKDETTDTEIAIARYNWIERNFKGYKRTKYEVLWRNKGWTDNNEWNSYGGSVGYNCADFNNVWEAEGFINKGLGEQIKNPEIWLEMVECK